MIDAWPITNAWYHSPQDTLDHVDVGYCAGVTRAVAAALVELGE